MDLGLAGRVIVVTGAAGSIGAAIARTLAAEDARVVVADLDGAGAERCAATIEGANGTAIGLELDVSSEASWRALVQAVKTAFGPVEGLVNNAGLNSVADAVDETVEGFQRIVAVNEIGVWLGMKHVIPGMQTLGRGSIVNIASISGVVAGFGRAIAYHATKASVSRGCRPRQCPPMSRFCASEVDDERRDDRDQVGRHQLRSSSVPTRLTLVARATATVYESGSLR